MRRGPAGKWSGGSIPLGYRLAADGRSLLRNRVEQRAIEMARELRKTGLSLRDIAERLDEVPLPTRSGRPWHSQQVARLLETE